MSRGARNGSVYRRLARQVARSGTVCSLCLQPMNQLKADGSPVYVWPHPMSAVADHTQAVARGGEVIDASNMRPAHKLCNERRGDGTTGQNVGPVHSREW